MEGGAVGHNFERDTPRYHLCQVWTLHRCLLPSLAPFGQAVSEEKICLTSQPIRKKELIMAAVLLAEWNQMKKLYRGSCIDASCQDWLHFAKQFQRILFKQQPIRNKNCSWRPYLLVERNEMAKHYRGLYIDDYCRVWFHLAKLFQRRRLKYEKVSGRTTDAK